jgi:MscS family membrane protein
VAFVVFLNLGLSIFEWPPKVRLYLSKALILIVAAALTYLAIKLVNALLDFWRARAAHEADRRFNDQLFSVLRKSLDTFIIILAMLVAAQNIGINITAAITSLSIGGLAVGLAAQDTLANLFGAVAIFGDKPFRIGDRIKIESIEGDVEEVGLRSTRVRNPDGYLVAIPNKTIANASVTNMTRRGTIKTVMNLVLPHTLPGAKIKRALAILEDVYCKHSMTDHAYISFNQFAGPNLNVMVVHWWKGTDYEKFLAGMQAMNLAVKEHFDAEGIALA